ncbi:MAG: START domain-containing protein [Pseudomonadota bacterium]
MKTLTQFMLTSILLAMSSITWSAEDKLEGWDFAKDKDGIKIYTRKLEGAVFKEFHATVKMKTTVADLVALYSDPAKCADWLPDCKSAHLVEKTTDAKFITYTEVNNPWPIKNRDYILQINVTRNSQTGEATIDFSDLKDGVPANKCCIRMGMVKGFWKFTPAEDGNVIVTYEYKFLPGGDLPVSAVNAAVPDLAYDTLTKMKQYIEHVK